MHSFVASIERLARDNGLEMVRFTRRKREDERARHPLHGWVRCEGVPRFGKAQDRTRLACTWRWRDPVRAAGCPWPVSSTAMVDQYHFYGFDKDFARLFVKFCSCFPFNAKPCRYGRENLKRQLARCGMGFEELDNGILRFDEPDAMQAIAREIAVPRIKTLFRRRMTRPPRPSRVQGRTAGTRTISSSCRRSSPRPRTSFAPMIAACFLKRYLARVPRSRPPEPRPVGMQVACCFLQPIRWIPETFPTGCLGFPTRSTAPYLPVFFFHELLEAGSLSGSTDFIAFVSVARSPLAQTVVVGRLT